MDSGEAQPAEITEPDTGSPVRKPDISARHRSQRKNNFFFMISHRGTGITEEKQKDSVPSVFFAALCEISGILKLQPP